MISLKLELSGPTLEKQVFENLQIYVYTLKIVCC